MLMLKNLLFCFLLALKSNDKAADKVPNKEKVEMENNMMDSIIFELGTLVVYTKQTVADYTAQMPCKEFYWRDAGSPQGYGPFKNLWDTMQHYTRMQNAFKSGKLKMIKGEAVLQHQVIQVDFRGKKRVK